jgi:hypothetical protein
LCPDCGDFLRDRGQQAYRLTLPFFQLDQSLARSLSHCRTHLVLSARGAHILDEICPGSKPMDPCAQGQIPHLATLEDRVREYLAMVQGVREPAAAS